MRKWLAPTLAATLAITGALSAPRVEAKAEEAPSALRLVYDEPAPLNQWEQRSLPIGNGAMGASVFGQLATDEVLLNEKTLWTGGPGSGGYRYGNYPESEIESRRANLERVRETINQQGSMDPGAVASLLGQPKVGYGSYQSFGKLRMQFDGVDGAVGYERSLDLEQALATVSYEANGTTFTREYLASEPDGVIALRISADRPGQVSVTTTFDRNASTSAALDKQGLAQAAITTSADGGIAVDGALADNGLRYHADTRIDAAGGDVTEVPDGIRVTGADSVTLFWSGGTDYELSYPDYRTGESADALRARIQSRVDAAAAKGYDAVRADHVADYRELFDRVTLDLNAAPLTTHTDDALAAYRGQSGADRALETLYYQFGRYLLISSSREGSLPANLQGVWNNRNNPPWSADYHTNINLQMNYWPALSSNLAETTKPYLAYVADLARAGADSARNVFGHDGWMVMNETTPFGFTGLFDWSTAFWFPEANAWTAQAFWWEYLYGGDEEFLREQAWPVLKGAADFWVDYLSEDPRDGSLVANPSYSPEHGPFTAGAAMSQQIATEAFDTVLAAASILGKDAEVADVAAARAQIDDGLHVGDDGLLREWKADGVAGEAQHRHSSHLYALFPGRAISPTATPQLAKAAEASLNDRGDGGTGWSMAWKVNFWAHLLDGDHAHRMLRNMISNSTYPNLWDVHPPFQIDGNFGATSGVNEMLVQNEADSVAVLPALPDDWAARGSFDGIRAWGGLEIGATWRAGSATEIRVRADRARTVRLATSMASAHPTVTDAGGAQVAATAQDGTISFDVAPGTTYTVRAATSVGFSWTPDVVPFGTQPVVEVQVQGAPEGSSLAVEVPEGWSVVSTSPVAVEGDARVRFTLQAPTSGSRGRIVARLHHDGGELTVGTTLTLVDPNLIPQDGLQLAAWSTQEPSGEGAPQGWAINVVDGDPSSFWHSRWSTGSDPHPHSLVIDLGDEYALAAMTFLPRQGTPGNGGVYNGTVTEYRVEVATEGDFVAPTTDQLDDAAYPEPAGVEWVPVAEGTWEKSHDAKLVEFSEAVGARYVRVTALAGHGGFSNAAEISFTSATPLVELPTPPAPEPTDDPTDDPTDEPTGEPTGDPTGDPTAEPTGDPTGDPTAEPTGDPTDDPTDEPTDEPTGDPTDDPTDEPTAPAPTTSAPAGPRPGLPSTGR